MRKVLRITLRVFLGLLVLFILAAGGLYAYVSYHKEALLARISSQFHHSCYGSLQIGDISPRLLSGFPDASVSLKNVVIRDSLWALHHRNLMEVAEIEVSVRILPLLAGNVEINKLRFRKGSINLFEDSNGYTNRHLFRPGKSKKNSEVVLKKFELEDIRFHYHHVPNRKLFDLEIRELKGKISRSGQIRDIRTRAEIQVHQCVFNELRGSFLKNKRLQCNLFFTYDKAAQILNFPKQRIRIDEHSLNAGATFELAPKPGIFRLDISDERLSFRDARTWLSPNISRHLDSFLLDKPIKVHAIVQGRMKDQPNPYVNVSWEVKDNTLHTAKGGLLEHCSFNGGYRNGAGMNSICGDEQSTISIEKASASWKQIPFRSDSFVVANLKKPRIGCRISSNFPLRYFNNITGGEVFRFDTGKAAIAIRYYGSLNPDDTVSSHIFGSIQISDAAFTYTPRNISFNHCGVQMIFKDQDISVPLAECRSKGSQLRISAEAKRFLALYRTRPEELLLTAVANSSRLNLDEFRSFLGQRKKGLPAKTYKSKMAERLDKAFDACSTDLTLHISNLRYHKFEASGINANILILQNGIRLRNVQLEHAGGQIAISGTTDQGSRNNHFRINTTVRNVAVDLLFNGFGNFGLQSLHAENIRGICSLEGSIGGSIDPSGDLVPGSLSGKIHFVLERGQLLHFRPLERMGRFAFRKKRLSEVSFGRISNTLTIEGNNILIPPMQVSSDLLDLNLQGVYSLGTETDLQIDIPLLSMSKDDINYNDESGGTGPRLHIRGKDDANGDLQFSWRLKDKAKKLQLRQERKERKARRRVLLGRLIP